jgi:hypothetical protein
MTKATIARMSVHISAMGHVIGRNGMTIRNIRNNNNVVIYNSKYSDDVNYVKFFIKGETENVEKAKAKIQEQINISNEWCKQNGRPYE